MAILRIKDENGNFIGVPAIQGEPGPKGEPGKDGYTPIKETDYYTEEDKQEIVELVLEALPSSEEVSY